MYMLLYLTLASILSVNGLPTLKENNTTTTTTHGNFSKVKDGTQCTKYKILTKHFSNVKDCGEWVKITFPTTKYFIFLDDLSYSYLCAPCPGKGKEEESNEQDEEDVDEEPDENFRMALYKFNSDYHPKYKDFKNVE